MSDATRICTKCGESKPLTEFHRDRTGPGGRRRQCKTCRCSQTMDWWYANQDRQLARHQEYVDANRERIREIDNARYWRDRESRLDLATSVHHARRVRRSGDADYDFGVTREVLRDRDGDGCNYCGRVMDFERVDRRMRKDKATIDHVVPISAGGSHTLSNTVLACWECNAAKRNEDADAFRERVKRRSPRGAA